MGSAQSVEPEQANTCGGNKVDSCGYSLPSASKSRGHVTNHKLPQTIAIAGAGLLGRLLAWQLQRAGINITLFEAGSFTPNTPQTIRAAAFTAAGMVAPLSEAVVSDEGVYRMGIFALQQWPAWFAQLPATKAPLFFSNGSLVVAHQQDTSELDQFERELGFILPGCNGYQRVNQHDIHQLEPDLHSNFHSGLFLREEGHVNNREFLRLIGDELVKLGTRIREFTSVEVFAGKIVTDSSEEHFDVVIDCRGLGAKQQLSNLRGVRGETLHVETKEIHLQRPVRLMHPRYQLYVVPKPNHRFIIGATQIESEDRSPVTIQSNLELSSALYTLSPAFAEARIIEMDTNLRPAFMNNLPKVTINEGLITANGLFRHGYLLAPAVVENVLAHIFNKPEPIFSDLLNQH